MSDITQKSGVDEYHESPLSISTPRHGHPHGDSGQDHEKVPAHVSKSIPDSLGSPTALAIGAFATTLTTLSLSLMEWRDVTTTNVYIGNFFFIAGIGMVISAQWELVRGNSFGYTVLSAFGIFMARSPTSEGTDKLTAEAGFFYGGFGAIITPLFGVADSYKSDTVEFNNALGLFVIIWAVFNFFFLIASLPMSVTSPPFSTGINLVNICSNLVYIGIFLTVELGFILVAAAYFAAADGYAARAIALKKAGGVFCFLSGLLGWYTLGHLMCKEATFLSFPMGDTSRFFIARKNSTHP